MIPTQGAKSLVPMPTGLAPATKGFSNLGQRPDQNGLSSSIENLEACEDPETLHISSAVFATLEGLDEEDFFGWGGQQSLQTMFQPVGGKRSAHLNSAPDGMSEDVVCQTAPSLGSAGVLIAKTKMAVFPRVTRRGCSREQPLILVGFPCGWTVA